MRRLIALIAVLFAFASLAGATTAHAHRYVSTPIVVLNHVDAQNQPIPVFVQIQRGQIDLGAGIVMPCGQHHGIGASVALVPAIRSCDRPEASLPRALGSLPSGQLLRPPISA